MRETHGSNAWMDSGGEVVFMVDKSDKSYKTGQTGQTDLNDQSDQDVVSAVETQPDADYENNEQLDLFLSLRVQNFLQEFQSWLNSPLTPEEEELLKSGEIDPDRDE